MTLAILTPNQLTIESTAVENTHEEVQILDDGHYGHEDVQSLDEGHDEDGDCEMSDKSLSDKSVSDRSDNSDS